jgi:hypothetical protein
MVDLGEIKTTLDQISKKSCHILKTSLNIIFKEVILIKNKSPHKIKTNKSKQTTKIQGIMKTLPFV